MYSFALVCGRFINFVFNVTIQGRTVEWKLFTTDNEECLVFLASGSN